MNFNDFVSQTNIKDIIKRECQKENNDADVNLSGGDMRARVEFFYKFRTETDRWHINGIKNLKFNECECKRGKSNAKTQEIGVQCSSTKKNKSTSTDDIQLQPAFELSSSDGNDTNAKCSDNTTDCTTPFSIN